MKVKIEFCVDLGKLYPEESGASLDPQKTAEELVKANLFDYTRHQALADLRRIQRDPSISKDEKTQGMALALRKAMLVLQAEGTHKLELLPEDTVISEDHPAEAA